MEPPRLYAIADRDRLAPTPLPEAVASMAEAGVEWIQVRAKSVRDGSLVEEVAACCRRLEGSAATLWVDDRVDITALLPVQGVHLGQSDLPPAAARRVLGAERWIGSSTHDLAQLTAAAADPAVDLVAVGPVFPTASKERPDPVVGLDLVREGRRLTAKPLVAIGGIDAANLGAVLEAGADAVAVLSAVCGPDLVRSCHRLLAAARAA